MFGVVEPKAGRHFTTATPDLSAFQFAQVVYRLALQYPEAKTIHLVMDNLNPHCRKSLTDLYGADIGGEIWTGSPSTTHPSMELARPGGDRTQSVLPAMPGPTGDFGSEPLGSARPRHGTVRAIARAQRSTGGSRGAKPGRLSTTKSRRAAACRSIPGNSASSRVSGPVAEPRRNRASEAVRKSKRASPSENGEGSTRNLAPLLAERRLGRSLPDLIERCQAV